MAREAEAVSRDLEAAHTRIDAVERGLQDVTNVVREFAGETRQALHAIVEKQAELAKAQVQRPATDWRAIISAVALVCIFISGGFSIIMLVVGAVKEDVALNRQDAREIQRWLREHDIRVSGLNARQDGDISNLSGISLVEAEELRDLMRRVRDSEIELARQDERLSSHKEWLVNLERENKAADDHREDIERRLEAASRDRFTLRDYLERAGGGD